MCRDLESFYQQGITLDRIEYESESMKWVVKDEAVETKI